MNTEKIEQEQNKLLLEYLALISQSALHRAEMEKTERELERLGISRHDALEKAKELMLKKVL